MKYDQIAEAYITLIESIEASLEDTIKKDIESSDRYEVTRMDSGQDRQYGDRVIDAAYNTKQPKGAVSFYRYAHSSRHHPEYMGWYDPKYAELHKEDEGEIIERRYPVLKQGLSKTIQAQKNPNLIYRGMSAEEFENIQKTGKIKSSGKYNMEGQEGLTYFSTDPEAAAYYAHGFAPLHFKASPEKPAYVVGVKNPGTGVKIAGTAEHEIGIPHEISVNDIEEIHQGIPYASTASSNRYRKSSWNGEIVKEMLSDPSTFIGWKRIK